MSRAWGVQMGRLMSKGKDDGKRFEWNFLFHTEISRTRSQIVTISHFLLNSTSNCLLSFSGDRSWFLQMCSGRHHSIGRQVLSWANLCDWSPHYEYVLNEFELIFDMKLSIESNGGTCKHIHYNTGILAYLIYLAFVQFLTGIERAFEHYVDNHCSPWTVYGFKSFCFDWDTLKRR